MEFQEYRTYEFDLTGLADSKIHELEVKLNEIRDKLGINWRLSR